MNSKFSPESILDKFTFRLKRHFLEVLKESNSDHSIAWGYALGTFIAILPTPGVSVFIGIGLIAIFKNINKLAVFIAMAIWNAFTVLPIYWLSNKVGNMIFESEDTIQLKIELMDQIFLYSRRFLIGNLSISIPLSILSYYFARYFVRNVRRRRAMRRNQF